MKAICKLEKETEIHVFPVVKSVFEVKKEEGKEFTPVFIYSANADDVSQREKESLSLLFSGQRLYQLDKDDNVQGVQRPGVDSPEIYLVGNGIVKNSISYGIIRPENVGIPDGKLTPEQLGQLVDKLN